MDKLSERERQEIIARLERLYEARHEATWQGDADEIDTVIAFYEEKLSLSEETK